MKGDLYEYSKGLVAFESGDLLSKKSVVLIGGLGDGFFTIPYTANLSEYLEKKGWSLVQILMKSSYSGYGTSSLQEDLNCIVDALIHLKSVRGKKEAVLLGHSTGCQDIMWLFSQWETYSGLLDGFLTKAILQAPVSDREYYTNAFAHDNEDLLDWARANSPDTVHPTERPPLSAYRIRALYERLGDDDFFSTDLTIEERHGKLKTFPIPTVIVFSGNDEYFPYKNKLNEFLMNTQQAWPEIEDIALLDKADHGITNTDWQDIFFTVLNNFIQGHGFE